MEQAVIDGKINSLGLSNYYIKELEFFLPQIEIKPVVVQYEIHSYYQETDVVAYIQRQGIAVEGWYPLGGRGYTEALLNNKELATIGAKYGKTAAQAGLGAGDVCRLDSDRDHELLRRALPTLGGGGFIGCDAGAIPGAGLDPQNALAGLADLSGRAVFVLVSDLPADSAG